MTRQMTIQKRRYVEVPHSFNDFETIREYRKIEPFWQARDIVWGILLCVLVYLTGVAILSL
jgi:hypothetical protein